MGLFSSGKSAAKRAAKKAESAQYDQYFAEAINSTRPKEVKLETNTSRYNAVVKEYNTRLDEITRQYKGEAITDKIGAITTQYRSEQAAKEAAKPKVNQGGLAGISAGGDFKQQSGGITGGIRNIGPGGAKTRAPEPQGLQAIVGSAVKDLELNGKTAKYQALNQGYKGVQNQRAAYDDLGEITKRLNQAAVDDGVEAQIGVENSPGHQVVKEARKKARSGATGRQGTILTGGTGLGGTPTAPQAKLGGK